MNSEEIKQMKGVNESEASWQRRKKFLIVCQSKFPKERLNTLSYCYVNVFLHKCTYSEKMMDDLYEMACDVANYQWDDPVNMSEWIESFNETLGVPVSGEKRKGKQIKPDTSVSCHDATVMQKYVFPVHKLKKSVGFKRTKSYINKLKKIVTTKPKCNIKHVRKNVTSNPQTEKSHVSGQKKVPKKSPKTELGKVALSEVKSPKTDMGKVALSEVKSPKTDMGKVALSEKKSPKTDMGKIALSEVKSPKTDMGKIALSKEKSPKTEIGKIVGRKLVCDTVMSVFNQNAPTGSKIKSYKLSQSHTNVNQQCAGTKNDNTTKNSSDIPERKVTVGQNCSKENINIVAMDNQCIRDSDNARVTRTTDSCIIKNSRINKSQRWKNRVISQVNQKFSKKKSSSEYSDTYENVDFKQKSCNETSRHMYGSENLTSQKLNVNEKQKGKTQQSLAKTCNTKHALECLCNEDFDVIISDNGSMIDINNNLETFVKNKNIDKSEKKPCQEVTHGRMFVNRKYKGNQGNSLATLNTSTYDGTYMSEYSTGTPKHVSRLNWPYMHSDMEDYWLGSGSWFGYGYSFPFHDSYVQYSSSYIPHSPVGNHRRGRSKYEKNFQKDSSVGRKCSSQSEYLFPKSVTDMTKNMLEFRGKPKSVLPVSACSNGENLLKNFKTALIPALNLEKILKKPFDHKKEDVFKFKGSGTTKLVSRKTTKQKEISECLRKNPVQSIETKTLVTQRSKTDHNIWLQSVLDQINKT